MRLLSNYTHTQTFEKYVFASIARTSDEFFSWEVEHRKSLVESCFFFKPNGVHFERKKDVCVKETLLLFRDGLFPETLSLTLSNWVRAEGQEISLENQFLTSWIKGS